MDCWRLREDGVLGMDWSVWTGGGDWVVGVVVVVVIGVAVLDAIVAMDLDL